MVIYKMDKYETFSETMEANAAALNGGISKIALENILKEYIATSPTTTNGVLTGGPLTLTADPTTPLQAATKQYVDSGDLALQTQVTSLQGTVDTLNANPVTLTYVDAQDALKVNKAGDTMTGPLVLPGAPTLVTHAVTKGYVDTAIASIPPSVSGVTQSYVDTAVATKLSLAGGNMTGPLALPADPTTPLQAATKQYSDSGDTALQTQVTTLQGTVGTLNANPVTLSYVDTQDTLKVNKAGDTMTGQLVLPGSPTLTTHATDKGYVDTLVTTHTANVALHLTPTQNTLLDAVTVTSTEINTLAGITSNIQTQINTNADNLQTQINNITSTVTTVPTGTVIEVDTATTPTNYLRANGTQISKTTYAALFAVIGDTYATTTMSSIIGQPWRQQYSFNTANSTIGTWVTDTSVLLSGVIFSQAIVTNNRVYLLGGLKGSITINTVYTTTINADGTLGTWVTSTPLPVALYAAQIIVTNNRVYLLGGRNSVTYLSTVYTAPINPDGTLGAWVNSTPLPGAVVYSQAIVTNNRVYLIGGYVNGIPLSTVYTTTINTDGTLGTWIIDIPLPRAVAHSQAIVTNNRVYLLGGWNGNYTSVVYTAPINPDSTLGTWTIDTPLPITIAHSQAIVTNNRVYLLGGIINGIVSAIVYTAPINPDGTLGTWIVSTSLPISIYGAQAIVTNNKVYIFTTKPEMYSAPFSGGLNNYLNPVSVNATTFTLPDYTIIDAVSSPKTYHYIKF